MERLIFGGVFVLGLAIFSIAAPQQNFRVDQQEHVSGGSNVLTSQKVSAYKNNTRENPPGEGELFGYPEDQSNIDSKQNANNRTPVFIPNRCQKNEILYPGDQESDWVCDCKPTFIYHPPTKQCHQLFTQGYCKGKTMLILKIDAKQPECVPNRCHRADVDMVEYEGECVKLNDYHDKCRHHDLKQLIGVREDTNQLGCVNISDVVGKYTFPSNSSMVNVTQQRGN